VTPRVKVETATLRGDGRSNQDTVIVTDRAVAVLDGATSWSAPNGGPVPDRDGGWYSRTLAAALLPRLDGDDALGDVVGAAIAHLRDTHGLSAGRGPESTVTIVRWDTTPATWDDAVDQLDRLGPAGFLAAVDAVEESDPDARRWPRAKRHDDKTIAVLRPRPPVASAARGGRPSVSSP
jgi:hypothetical protein